MEVYYRKIFKNDVSWNFEWRKFFSEFHIDIFSDCPSDVYTSVSEDDSSSEYIYSDDVNIRPTKRQKLP